MDTTLFDNIIAAIESEKQSKATRKILFLFLFLLGVSVLSIPFSFTYLMRQCQTSGIFYFMSAPFLNFSMFFHFWQDFMLSIIESFPIGAVILFFANLALLLFTIRLFLHQKGVLLTYLTWKTKIKI